jgi:hypothetical protein
VGNNKIWYKPINILYEVGLLLIFTLFIHISNDDFFYLLLFALILLTSITFRTLVSQQANRRNIASFIFGYVFGIYVWSQFQMSEYHTIESLSYIKQIIMFSIGCLAGGFIFAIGAVFISSIFNGILKSIIQKQKQ